MAKVVITADAACDLPLTILKKYNVETLKCTIRTRTGDFLENGEVTAENLLEYIKKYKNFINNEYILLYCPTDSSIFEGIFIIYLVYMSSNSSFALFTVFLNSTAFAPLHVIVFTQSSKSFKISLINLCEILGNSES